jgi:long-chain acyl-CoA synthetase
MAVKDLSIPALLSRCASETPGATILRKKDRGIWKATDWASLAHQARGFSGGLAARGLARGSVVGVLSEISPHAIAADLGTLGAGMVALGLQPSESGDAIAHVLADSGCVLVFVEGEEQLDKILHIRDRCANLRFVVIIDTKGLHDFVDPICEGLTEFLARGAPGVFVEITPDDVAVLAYTAGSTGAPRGVRLSHRNIMAQVTGALAVAKIANGDERLAFLPLALLTERVLGLYLSLAGGCISNLVESVETVPENLAEVRPTILIVPPRVWQRLASGLAARVAGASFIQRGLYNWALGSGSAVARRLVITPALAAIGLDRVRCAWVGGAPVAPTLLLQFAALGIKLTEFYGLTEASGLASLEASIPGFDVRIAGDGEIQLRGPHIGQGYQDTGLFTGREGWLATGDIGRIENGKLRVDGRVGEQIALATGVTVMPATIEATLRVSRFIADALVRPNGMSALACVLMVEQDVLDDWAQSQDFPPGNFSALVQSPAVRDLLQGEIKRVNAATPIKITEFTVIDRRLEPGDPELTPMMMLRRDFVIEKYRDLPSSVA